MNSRPTEQQRLRLRVRPENQRPALFQTWSDLLFLHWRVPAAELQPTLPAGLWIDTFDDAAWVGIVPFRMRRIRPRGLFPVPWLSYFLELNVRTYVHDRHGNPGVWFFSLEANRWLACKIGRARFHLPYFQARMRADRRSADGLDYRCRRLGSDAGESRYDYRSRSPADDAQEARAGSLEFFLLERYRLYSQDPRSGELYAGQVSHRPYRYRAAQLDAWDTLPLTWNGLPGVAGPPAHAVLAEPVAVDVFALQRLAG